MLDKISLTFDSGYLHAILGPNGSGKSTLLKTLSGIWTPTAGTVLWNEAPLLSKSRSEISRIISLVPQNPQPPFDFIVQDIVAMGRYPYDTRYWNAADEPLVQQSLERVDAWHLRHRRIAQLSQGEKQRIYIARALVTESPILLLDEPTTSLDIQHKLEIWQLLQRCVENGKLIVVTTHDLTIAKHYCQRVAVLNHGNCIGSGAFDALMTPHLLKAVFGVIEAPHSKQCKSYHLP